MYTGMYVRLDLHFTSRSATNPSSRMPAHERRRCRPILHRSCSPYPSSATLRLAAIRDSSSCVRSCASSSLSAGKPAYASATYGAAGFCARKCSCCIAISYWFLTARGKTGCWRRRLRCRALLRKQQTRNAITVSTAMLATTAIAAMTPLERPCGVDGAETGGRLDGELVAGAEATGTAVAGGDEVPAVVVGKSESFHRIWSG